MHTLTWFHCLQAHQFTPFTLIYSFPSSGHNFIDVIGAYKLLNERETWVRCHKHMSVLGTLCWIFFSGLFVHLNHDIDVDVAVDACWRDPSPWGPHNSSSWVQKSLFEFCNKVGEYGIETILVCGSEERDQVSTSLHSNLWS